MVEFLMLGIIPGTGIQINFSNWLMASSILATCIFLAVVYKMRRHILLLIALVYRYLSAPVWLTVLWIQLAWQLRRTPTLW